jgi:hypothetical protein
VTDRNDPKFRKDRPLARGVMFYFPDALLEVANVSRLGNEQHNPGLPMHWAFGKSSDHADCAARHLIDHERDPWDTEGGMHLAKAAWRALAALQTFLEANDPELHATNQAMRDRQAGKKAPEAPRAALLPTEVPTGEMGRPCLVPPPPAEPLGVWVPTTEELPMTPDQYEAACRVRGGGGYEGVELPGVDFQAQVDALRRAYDAEASDVRESHGC